MAGLQAGSQTQNGLVAESDFSYELPNNTPEYDLRGAEQDFLKQFANGIQGEADQEVSRETEVESETEPESQDEVGTSNIETDETDDIEDPKLARGVQRLVARELAAKQREDEADRKIAELKALQAEVSKYKDLRSAAELADMMDVDPLGAFKALGKNPEDMIKLALAQQLGDEAPDKLKDFAREANTRREIAQLKAQLAAQNQARAAQEYFNTIQSGAREYALGLDKEVKPGKKVGDGIPTLSLVAKADPDYARDEIMEEIVAEARRKAAEDPNGEPISYEEAAKRVEARLAKLAKLLQVQNGTTTPTKNGKPATKVIPPTTKPATKPIAPWMRNPDSIEEQGLQEALRVYERVEAERKARRLSS